MVVHMLESPDVTVRDLVEAVRKIEAMNEWWHLQWIDATQYPPSMSSTYNKLTYGKNKDHDKDKKDHKDKHNGHSGGVIKANPQHIESEVESQSSNEDAEAAHAADDDALWRDSYYCCAIQQAEEAEHFYGVCYSCKKAGHAWWHCTEPLRPALQEIKDWVGVNGKRLNVSGDGGNKGAVTPQKGKGAVAPAKPKK